MPHSTRLRYEWQRNCYYSRHSGITMETHRIDIHICRNTRLSTVRPCMCVCECVLREFRTVTHNNKIVCLAMKYCVFIHARQQSSVRLSMKICIANTQKNFSIGFLLIWCSFDTSNWPTSFTHTNTHAKLYLVVCYAQHSTLSSTAFQYGFSHAM